MLLPYLVLGAFYLLVVFRLQLRPINDVVRLFNKRLLNPVMMALDRRHWYAAVLKHKGRRSGNEYTTPVTVGRAGDSFVIPLSYGEAVDWLKNVRAVGRCSIATRSDTYLVGDPEVIDRAHAFAIVPRYARLMFRLFGIERYVKVNQISEPSAEATVAAVNSRGDERPPILTREFRRAKSKPSYTRFGG